MNIYIQTRSVMKDYQFLGDSPTNNWWMAYKEYTSFEHPTVIVKGNADQQWQIYLSGMSSSRVDKVNTPIRYTLILEDTKPVLDSELPQLLGLIQAWTEAIYDSESKIKLKSSLDNLFSTDEIDTYFSSSEQNKEKIQSRFQQWLCDFSYKEVGFEVVQLSKSYIGSQQSQSAFYQRCKSILQMKESVQMQSALHLNYIESKKELENTQLSNEDEYKFRFTLLVEAEEVKFSEIHLKKKATRTQELRQFQTSPTKFPNKILYLVLGMILIILVVLFI
ncbi:hypothetical protein MXL26_11020 [Acinetobacter towneri]|uniref:hypothetical protein n=1 Tax=Acinetobacter towneri TaxID=202956 RepID=UPI002DBE65B9|nr:hypothetical protein [Acinetobacter towneri]MEB6565869.1 hypothetical protein [Acinetobacter towneri]